jgi:hypothetical protein
MKTLAKVLALGAFGIGVVSVLLSPVYLTVVIAVDKIITSLP